MSSRALLLAVRDHLRGRVEGGVLPAATSNDGLGYTRDQCGVRPPPGRPPAIAGNLFVAVWCPSWTGKYVEGLDEYVTIKVTVSLRSPVKPDDRYDELLANEGGLLWHCERIRATLHMQYNEIMNLANDTINKTVTNATNGAVTAANGFVEPLFFTDGGQTEEKGGSWFKANAKEQSAALVQTITLGPARRVQIADFQT